MLMSETAYYWKKRVLGLIGPLEEYESPKDWDDVYDYPEMLEPLSGDIPDES